MTSAWVTALVGVALGMRHALEPDHLAAVSTLATEQRDARAGVMVGALWGIGHSTSLLLVGGSLALLEAQMPVRLAQGFELLVAVMIVALGVRAMVRAVAEGRRGAASTHTHDGGAPHTHPAPVEHVHAFRWVLATRPLLVGLVHGLAGSGALTALVLAELPTTLARLTYIAVFGAGSVLGMALLTGLAGVPLLRLSRTPRLAAALLGVAGLLSTGIGLWWGALASQQLFWPT
jgi:high-affinity nickel-transport protein